MPTKVSDDTRQMLLSIPLLAQSRRSDLDMTKTTMVASEATRQPGLAELRSAALDSQAERL
jgi:hypothetical protein